MGGDALLPDRARGQARDRGEGEDDVDRPHRARGPENAGHEDEGDADQRDPDAEQNGLIRAPAHDERGDDEGEHRLPAADEGHDPGRKAVDDGEVRQAQVRAVLQRTDEEERPHRAHS
ncbi:Uncharacterised protein [Mycobacteroides abscessus subsp. abscessus]|nr:Uncharacterised protein [Mycobacteroides abscessus subsp. abscessus]